MIKSGSVQVCHETIRAIRRAHEAKQRHEAGSPRETPPALADDHQPGLLGRRRTRARCAVRGETRRQRTRPAEVLRRHRAIIGNSSPQLEAAASFCGCSLFTPASGGK